MNSIREIGGRRTENGERRTENGEQDNREWGTEKGNRRREGERVMRQEKRKTGRK